MYRVFNMGIGMLVVCSHSRQLKSAKPAGSKIVGKIVKANKNKVLIDGFK